MAEETTRRVLLCGGHMDGRWITLPVREHSVVTALPGRIDYAGALSDTQERVPPGFERVEYRVELLPLTIRSSACRVYIGLPSNLYGAARDEAVIRAIFQRDVAQQVLGDR